MTTSLACVCVGLIAIGLTLQACAADPGKPAGAIVADPRLKNPEFLEQYAATRGFTHGTPKNIALSPDGSVVFFLRSGPRSFVQDLFAVDTSTGKESTFLTADKILAGNEEKLTAEELARRERMRLASRGIASYSISKDGKRILVPLSGRLFVVERNAAAPGSITELKSTAGYPIDPQFSPDATKVACVRDGDLYVIDIATGTETRLTTKTSDTITNGLAEFVAQEEMDRFRGYWWSPDSKSIAYEQADIAGMETFHIADAMSPEKDAQAWPYPRPGKKNASVRLGVIPVDGGATAWVSWDPKLEYLAAVSWPEIPDSGGDSPLILTAMNREQTTLSAFSWRRRSDGSNIPAQLLALDRDSAWINLRPGLPRLVTGWGHRPTVMLKTTASDAPPSHLLWISDSDGRSKLTFREFSGAPSSDAPGEGEVQAIAGVSHDSSSIFVLSSDDPTQTHIWRLDRDGGSRDAAHAFVKRLTTDAGVHGLVITDKSDRAVFSAALLDGRLAWKIANLDSSTTPIDLNLTRETPPWTPRLELEVVGEKKYNAALIRPRDFDPNKKYPVIVNVYGGPHHQMVKATPNAYFLQQWIADQGFIIAMIDGRGTPNRGRDWERAIKNDLIGPALEDQVAGLQALGAKHREMDLSRVGIYGWSFGGYFSAMATMQRPDVFHAGCAGAPVCDWLDYDTCYTERYLGVPKNADDEVYKKSNVLTYCKDLKVPLMIIHGTSDDNVYFMHSLKMTQALFREGKHFEFLPLAGFTHMVPDPVVTTRLYSRIALFFKDKLGEPK